MTTEIRPKRRCVRMKVLIGVDPHKASVAVAVVDEATGELVECASFPQNRAGLRALENAGRNCSPSVVGRWRTCHPSFRHGCEYSRAATPARTMGWTPSLLCVGRLAQRAAGSGRSRGQ